jgi:hypothetical protein
MESDSDSSDDEDSDAEESVDEGDQDGTGVPTLVDPATFDNGMATPSGKFNICHIQGPDIAEFANIAQKPTQFHINNRFLSVSGLFFE